VVGRDAVSKALALLAVVMVAANSGVSDQQDVRSGRFASNAPLRAGAPVASSNRSRVFAWPSHATSTYRRAARMARHGDPEAGMFVGGKSDINPFDVQ
jgi:hypothetical protein